MKVAIIDNDPAILRSVQILLTQAGHFVRAFSDCREALAQFALEYRPDVIILDFVMPEMNGDCFLSTLRSSVKEIPRVILISGHAELVARKISDLRVDHFLPKPVDFDALLRLVDEEVVK
ncbi:MAG: response regulator [Candidatus Brocadiia bacterium]